MIHIRKAASTDLPAVAAIYDSIHDAEEAGQITTGWLRNVYPTEATASAALQRSDLFVLEDSGQILAAAIINQIQVDVYAEAPWGNKVPDGQVCVLHTLTVSPKATHRGLRSTFVRFYEEYAAKHNCPELRIDTNERNLRARAMYKKLGYKEIGIVPTVFNGIPGVNLVLMEKSNAPLL